MDFGIHANIAEQDRSRATYAEAARSHTPVSKVLTVPRQPQSVLSADEPSLLQKCPRKENSRGKVKNDAKLSISAAQDVILSEKTQI